MLWYICAHRKLVAASGYHVQKQGAIHQPSHRFRFPGIIVHDRSAIFQTPNRNATVVQISMALGGHRWKLTAPLPWSDARRQWRPGQASTTEYYPRSERQRVLRDGKPS